MNSRVGFLTDVRIKIRCHITQQQYKAILLFILSQWSFYDCFQCKMIFKATKTNEYSGSKNIKYWIDKNLFTNSVSKA